MARHLVRHVFESVDLHRHWKNLLQLRIFGREQRHRTLQLVGALHDDLSQPSRVVGGLFDPVLQNILGGLVHGIYHIVQPSGQHQNILSVYGGHKGSMQRPGDVMDYHVPEFLFLLDLTDFGLYIVEVGQEVQEPARHILNIDGTLMQHKEELVLLRNEGQGKLHVVPLAELGRPGGAN